MIWIVVLLVVLAFQFVVLFLGAPYVRTLKSQRKVALDLLDLKKGQTLIDLGCGDGAMLIDAARRGIKSVGYEINPFLVAIAWIRTRRYGRSVKIVQGNFWHKKWQPADAVFVFLTDRYMEKLDRNMKTQFNKPVKLVTFGFSLHNKKSLAQSQACFLYKY